MTVKEVIERAIQMGMTEFEVSHYKYHGRCYRQTTTEIFDFISGYEDCLVVSCYFGNYISYYSNGKSHYPNPNLCGIIYRLPDEKLGD